MTTTSDATERWGATPWRVSTLVPNGPLPERADAVVVGAGFTGLATAGALARRGLAVAVLEAEELGAGASGRTGGLVLEHTAVGPRPGVDDCVPFLERLVAEHGIECELRIVGCDELEHRPAALASAPGWHDGEAALAAVRRVAGGTVDPGALVSGLARVALAAGATIHEHTPAIAIEPGSPLRVVTDAGAIAAEHVVLALNAYTPTLLVLPVEMRAPLTLALCTAPLGADTRAEIGIADVPFYTSDLPYLWGRTLPDGRLIFGSGLAFDPTEDVRRVALASGDAAAAMSRLEERVRALHPRLADVPVVARWGGPIAFRQGGVPILCRHPTLPGVIVTGAYAGHGVALSVRAGTLVAEAIVDGQPLPSWAAI